MKRFGFLFLLVAAVAFGAGETAIDYGHRQVNGNLKVKGTTTLTGPQNMPGVLSVGVLDAGTVKADVVDAGALLAQTGKINSIDAGDLNVVGIADIGTARVDVVDAGVICLGATASGCIYRAISFTTAAIDFAASTIVCEDSAGTTVAGAKTTDSCFVGMPSTLTGAGTGLHHNFTCYVSATDTVKIRACAAGTSDNPGSVTFTGYVIGAVP